MITIRVARLDDEASLQPIDRATWTSAVSPDPPSDPAVPLLDERTTLADVLVADDGGHAIGYVRLQQSGPLPSHAHVLTINGLAVAPDRQREGVGRRLVDAAVEEAGRRGARKVSLRVLAPNTGARRLYEACGFTVEGVLVEEFHLDGRYVDDVLMARDVREAQP